MAIKAHNRGLRDAQYCMLVMKYSYFLKVKWQNIDKWWNLQSHKTQTLGKVGDSSCPALILLCISGNYISWALCSYCCQRGSTMEGSGGILEDRFEERPENFSPSCLHPVASPPWLQLRPCCGFSPCRTAHYCPSSPNSMPLFLTSELDICLVSQVYCFLYHLFSVLNSCW